MVELNKRPENAKFKIHARTIGKLSAKGRRNPQNAYVNELLDYKIIVLAQRNYWEDHYRLFEAMSGGAMVLSDPMLPLPKGLVDGTHLVVYDSIKSLKEKIIYYLEHRDERLRIAREGHKETLLHHRTWHHMEDIFLNSEYP